MTYKEELLKTHSEEGMERIIKEHCPSEYFSNVPIMKGCEQENEKTCEKCWNRQIQQEEEKAAEGTLSAYVAGLNDVWITLKKFSNLSGKDRGDFFDTYDLPKLLENFTPQEVLKRMNYYEKSIKKGIL